MSGAGEGFRLVGWTLDTRGHKIERFESQPDAGRAADVRIEVSRVDGRSMQGAEASEVVAWYWAHVGTIAEPGSPDREGESVADHLTD